MKNKIIQDYLDAKSKSNKEEFDSLEEIFGLTIVNAEEEIFQFNYKNNFKK